jgi:hypothetical protein
VPSVGTYKGVAPVEIEDLRCISKNGEAFAEAATRMNETQELKQNLFESDSQWHCSLLAYTVNM